MPGDDIYYLKSIHAQLKQIKDGIAFSRLRSALGELVLTDNIDWLDYYIGELEAKKAKRGK